MKDGSVKEIVLGDEFGDIAVRANGVRVDIYADGRLEVHTKGSIAAYTMSDVDAYTNGAVHVHAAVNDDARPADQVEPKIGDKMPAGHQHAGWIYAGISRTTHEPFYAGPKGSGVFQWKEAMAFAAKDGSRLPSREELDQLYDAKDKGALKGTFNVTGSYPAGWYWSSSQGLNIAAWAQRLSHGDQSLNLKDYDSSLRCVR